MNILCSLWDISSRCCISFLSTHCSIISPSKQFFSRKYASSPCFLAFQRAVKSCFAFVMAVDFAFEEAISESPAHLASSGGTSPRFAASDKYGAYMSATSKDLSAYGLSESMQKACLRIVTSCNHASNSC